MAKAGVSKPSLAKLGGTVACFMADGDLSLIHILPLQLSQQRVRGRIVQKFVEALVHHKACAAGGAPL